MRRIENTWLSARRKEVLEGERSCLYDSAKQEWHFCHHPALGVFQGTLYAMWSNGPCGEDEPGQRVQYAFSSDGSNWSEPQILCPAWMGKKGYEVVLTAAGFYACEDQLNAYISSYEYETYEVQADRLGRTRLGANCIDPKLYVLTSRDGIHWSEPQDLSLPMSAVGGPRKLRSGRLLIEGNWAHAWTDDPKGLTGWTLSGFCPDNVDMNEPPRDDPSFFWKVSERLGLDAHLCEGSFVEGKDGTLHMLYRSYTPWLWQSDSYDGGESWTFPEKTDFPDGNSKFCMRKLPDGRWIYVGNPGPDRARCPLVISVSEDDGWTFDTHYQIETEMVPVRFPGFAKGGIYGYPNVAIDGGFLYIIYSVWKEDMIVQRISLDRL